VPESRPHPLGVHCRDGGIDVAVLASHADRVELCLLDPVGDGWAERRVDLPNHTYGVWHGFVPGVPPGQHYGLRVHGPWEPARGHRHNPAKLLLDPYARAVRLPATGRPELYGHQVDDRLRGDPGVRDDRDSAPFAAHGVVTAPLPGRPALTRPGRPWSETVVYEAHVAGLTRLMPAVPEPLRGSYAGLAHPAAIEHLLRLGVTAVELLPVHAFTDEPHLDGRGLTNYWGYNTLGFFAPHPRYAATGDPGQAVGSDPRSAVTSGPRSAVTSDPRSAVAEFAGLVEALHAAGLELILDVVYNHTCEGDVSGRTLSWRGLDAAGYYRLDPYGRDIDVTGCGNTLDARQARVVQLTLDSLRYWADELGVDGFRFDLAPALARGRDGFDPDHPFLVAARADPVLAEVKLIAEPWDVGPHGWRTGQFPPPFAEWNDRFRDGVRSFWLRAAVAGQPTGVSDLATRLAGSADLFAAERGPLASINFVAAHDGFTLADTTAYDHKHNEANGEQSRDGADDNRSANHGVEGPTDDEHVRRARRTSIRNLLGTLLLSTGVPMLAAGDELGRSQGGNNNAYCQDSPLSWVDWDLQPWQHDLLATAAHLIRLRREYPVLRQDRFFGGRPVHADGTLDLAWFDADGAAMDSSRWHDPDRRVLLLYLHEQHPGRRDDAPDPMDGGGSLLLVVQGASTPVDVVLPGPPWAAGYRLLWDSALDRPPIRPGPLVDPGLPVTVPGPTLRVYRAE
jgi:glycogen operon protein